MALALKHYALGLAVSAPLAGAPYISIKPATRIAIVRRVSVTITAATASSIGLIRAATAGTASTTTTGEALNPADGASTAGIVTAWSGAPTISGTPVYLRRIVLPATANTTVTWDFEDAPIYVEAATPLLLWNYGAGTASASAISVDWSEAA